MLADEESQYLFLRIMNNREIINIRYTILLNIDARSVQDLRPCGERRDGGT